MRIKLLTTRNAGLAILSVLLAICLALGIILLPKTALAEDDQALTDDDLSLVEAAGWFDNSVSAPEGFEIDKENVEYGYYEIEECLSATYNVKISTAEGLAYLSRLVNKNETIANDGEEYYAVYNVTLENDIDLGGKLWIPIGTTSRANAESSEYSANLFRGTFDGNGYTISGLYSKHFYNNMSYTAAEGYYIDCGEKGTIPFEIRGDEEYCWGLFATTAGAEFKNLTVSDVQIDMVGKNLGASKTTVTDGVGSIVGLNIGSFTMTNCTAGQPEDGSYIKNTMATGGLVGRVYAYDEYVGSAASDPTQDILFEKCYNYIDLGSEGEGDKKAGIVAINQYFKNCVMKDCINYGNIYGGSYGGGMTAHFMGSGYNLGNITVENCVNYGNINKVKDYAGGIAAILQFNTGGKIDKTAIKNCLNYGEIKSIGVAGGISGWIQPFVGQDISVLDCFNYGDVTGGGNNVGGICGWLNQAPKSLKLSGGNYGTVSGGDYAGSCVGNNAEFSKIYFIDATATNTTSHNSNSSSAETEATLTYDETGKVVTGIETSSDDYLKVVIPSGVEKIALGAFAGERNIVEVVFEEGSSLTEIGDWAFAGTEINNIVIPESVTEIGLAAFADCEYLNYLTLCEKAENITFGDNFINGGAYIIATDRTQYDVLSEKLSDYENITYIVTITYSYLEILLDSEERLFGQNYALEFSNGRWIENADAIIGTSKAGAGPWYADAEGEGEVLQKDTLSTLLGTVEGEEIELYALDTEEKVFVARNDLVYDGKSYGMEELNPLLHSSSDLILKTMTVSITGFTDADGNVADNDKLPENICDAGEYTLLVVGGSYESESTITGEFTITIHRATVNLGDYDNLSWGLTKIGETATNSPLLSSGGVTLYIYKTESGVVYPSTVLLSSQQMAQLNLTGEPDITTVIYSVVRNRNDVVTVGIANNSAYDVLNYEYATGEEIGKYTTSVTVKATANYNFTATGINAMRGLTIDVSDDGTQATITKEWYIVDIGNWLVNSDGSDYNIENQVYGNVSASAPQLKYTGTGGTISMALYLNNTLIGNESFTIADFDKYINDVMPAGNYRLVVTVGGVTSSEVDEENTTDPANPVYVEVYHNGFSETVEFTVDKRELPSLTELNTALKGSSFTYLIEDTQLLSGNAEAVVAEYLSGVANASRTGTVWEDYSSLYSSFTISYNLARQQNDEYSSSVDTSGADTYTVYYKISALNYYSSIENLKNETRWDYYFTVINVATVEIPVIASKTYTGTVLYADINDGQYFTVESSKGGTNVTADGYDVVLKLRDSVHYMWAGDTLEDRNEQITVKFYITKAANDWNVAPNVIGWDYKNYSADANLIMGAVVGGTVTFKVSDGTKVLIENITLTEVENGNYYVVSDEVGEKLYNLSAGTYYLTATVAPDGNHNGLAEQTIEFVVSKAVNKWTANVDVISWAYGSYDSKVNRIFGDVEFGTVTFVVLDKDGKEVTDKFTTVTDAVAKALSDLSAGTYKVTGTVSADANYTTLDAGETTLTITKADNYWTTTPSVVSWVKGDAIDVTESIFAEAAFGNVDLVIKETTNEENVIYKVVGGKVEIDELANAKVGYYTLTATVDMSDDWTDLEKTFTFQIFAPEGLAWWVWLIIIVVILAVIAVVFIILHEKGVLQMLTEKIVVSMRTRMSVDATIAAVRANKRAEEAKKSIAEAEAREKREAFNAASPEEQAAILEEKAQQAQEIVDKMRGKIAEVKGKASDIKARNAETSEPAEQTEEASDNEEKGE